jgi:hypothetical protein
MQGVQLVPLYADLYVKAMDWPGAQQIAERVKPPNVPDDDQPPIPPQAMQQIQQLTEQNQMLQQQVQQAAQIINSKQVEQQGRMAVSAQDNATRMQIAQLQAQVDLILKRQDLGVKTEDIDSKETMHAAGLDSAEAMKQADLESRENIALFNARVRPRGNGQ